MMGLLKSTTIRGAQCLTALQPIFLRACHSPWSWLPQGALVSVRGAILAHLTTLAFMLLDYKVYKREDGDTAWRIIFQFSTVTFVLLWFYHLLTFVRILPIRWDLFRLWMFLFGY